MSEIFGDESKTTCPYCNHEMKMGYIKSSHAILWGPEREPEVAKNDLCLAKLSLRGLGEGLFVKAYYCRICRKLIVSLDEQR